MGKTYSKRQKQVRKQPWFNPGNDPYGKFIEDPQEYRACAKKNGSFNYEKEALAHAANFKHVVALREETLVWHAYECQYCGKWHLSTNQSPYRRKEYYDKKAGKQ